MQIPLTISDRQKPAVETKHLSIGSLIYDRVDQIDFTGPFEVLSRIPDATVHVIGKTMNRVRDLNGLILTPETTIEDAPAIDVLHIPGGFGQQDLMHDEAVLSLIRKHALSGRLVFSVCTGALLCGAAGILAGREATTHWSVWDLLPYYGAVPVQSRVVVDGNIITCSGATAGIDGALVVASLLRGEMVAQRIQLSIEYTPAPLFNSGTPETASAAVLAAVKASHATVREAREEEARRFGAQK